jgi:ankyrin repeat protein
MRACLAAYKGDVATLKKLKSKGLNFDNVDYDGSGPLYYAIRGNQTAAVKYILQYNVNVNVADRWGGTALNFVKPGTEMETLLI